MKIGKKALLFSVGILLIGLAYALTSGTLILVNDGTAQTLNGVASTWSVTTPNQTWLKYDGVNDYMTINNYSMINSGFTFIAVINSTGYKTGDAEHLFANRNSSTSGNKGFNFGLLSTTHRLNFQISNGTSARVTADGTTAINDSTIRIVGLSLSSNINLYNNGNNEKTQSANGTATDLNTNILLRIGAGYNNSGIGSPYNGSIYEAYLLNTTVGVRFFRDLQNQSIYGSNKGGVTFIYNLHGVANGMTLYNINITTFSDLCAKLDELGFTSVTYKQLAEYKAGTRTLSERNFIFSFDDNDRGIYTNAVPIMDSYGFIGSWAVRTNDVGGDATNITWNELSGLVAKGWEILPHSINHGNLVAYNLAEVSRRLNISGQSILGNISYNSTAFIYPSESANDSIHDLCLQKYTFCVNASSDEDDDFNNNYKFQINNITLRRITVIYNHTVLSNLTPMFEYQQVMDDNKFLYLRLNENNGTTAYDVTGNNNNGNITGATWQTDGQTKTLVDGTDYTITKGVLNTVFTIINTDYLYTYYTLTYTIYSDERAAVVGLCEDVTDGIDNFGGYIPTAFTILGAIFILGFIGFLVFVVYMFRSGNFDGNIDLSGINMGLATALVVGILIFIMVVFAVLFGVSTICTLDF